MRSMIYFVSPPPLAFLISKNYIVICHNCNFDWKSESCSSQLKNEIDKVVPQINPKVRILRKINTDDLYDNVTLSLSYFDISLTSYVYVRLSLYAEGDKVQYDKSKFLAF